MVSELFLQSKGCKQWNLFCKHHCPQYRLRQKDQKVSESAETTLTVEAGSSAEASTNNVVTNPSLWSLDDPTQYYVRTEILSGGNVIDTYDTAFGFRWYKFTKIQDFSLNGKM